MQPLEFLVPLGALEAVEGLLSYAVLALVLVNFVTRHLAHRAYKSGAEAGDDDEAIDRFTPHVLVNLALLVASMLFMVVQPHAGMVTTVLVLGLVLTDFFEFESRKVEARNALDFEKPKAAIAASVLTLLYTSYTALFWIIKDYWNMVI